MLGFVKKSFFLILLLAFCVPIGTAISQTSETSIVQPSDAEFSQAEAEKEFQPDKWTGVLNSSQQALDREGIDDSAIDAIINEASGIRDRALNVSVKMKEQLKLLKERLTAIGPEPKEGEPEESADTKNARAALNAEYSQIDESAKLASDISLRAAQLRTSAVQLRHDRFFREILGRNLGVFRFEFWGKFASGFAVLTKPILLLWTDSVETFFSAISDQPQKLLIVIVLLAGAWLGFSKLSSYLTEFEARKSSHLLAHTAHGFSKYLRLGVLPALLMAAVYFSFKELELLTGRLESFVDTGLFIAAIGYLAICLFRLITDPNEKFVGLMRITQVAADKARSIVTYGISLAILLSLMNALAVTFVLPIEARIGLGFLSSLTIAATSVLALMAFHRGRESVSEDRDRSTLDQKFRWIIWAISIGIVIAAFTGFVSLAEFLSHQLIFGFVVLISSWLLLRYVDFQFDKTFGPVEERAETSGTQQIAIFGNGVLHLAIYIAAAIALLVPWGYRTSDFFDFIQTSFFDIQIGEINISIYNIFSAIALFLIGYWITVSLRSWLGQKFLPATSIDIGLRNSISTIFGYVGFGFAALFAVSAAGFDLSNLAIVAGALSVGIGFGLQSVVSNFVSGLILLAERPIKSGDWIETSGGNGYVRKISVRSTEIETFDQATTIVPNSSLITEPVKNWTHLNKNGRLIISIGVGYDSDPEKVRTLLLKCAEEHSRVKKLPAPNVVFMDFGASSLDFQLRCYVYDVNERLTVQSDLRFAILKAMRKAKIEIPFPQRVVTINNSDGE